MTGGQKEQEEFLATFFKALNEDNKGKSFPEGLVNITYSSGVQHQDNLTAGSKDTEKSDTTYLVAVETASGRIDEIVYSGTDRESAYNYSLMSSDDRYLVLSEYIEGVKVTTYSRNGLGEWIKEFDLLDNMRFDIELKRKQLAEAESTYLKARKRLGR